MVSFIGLCQISRDRRYTTDGRVAFFSIQVGTHKLYLVSGKQALPPTDPPLAFVDSSAAQLDSLFTKELQ